MLNRYVVIRRLAWGGGLLCGMWLFQGCGPSEPSTTPGSSAAESATAKPPAPEPLTLQWKALPKSTFRQRLELQETSRLQFPARPQPLLQAVDLTQEFEINVVESNLWEATLKSMQIESSINNQKVMQADTSGMDAEDGASLAGNSPQGALALALGHTLTFLWRNPAEGWGGLMVKEVDALRQVFNRTDPQARSVLLSVITESLFKLMVLDARLLPSSPVVPGDQWNASFATAMGPLGTAQMNVTGTFDRQEEWQGRQCAVLKLAGDFATTEDGAGSGPMGMKTKIDKGTVLGTVWFDAERGQAVRLEMNHVVDMNMEMAVPRIGNQGGGSQTMASHLDRVIKWRWLNEPAVTP